MIHPRRSAAEGPVEHGAQQASTHPLQLWLFEPAASPNDSRWQDRPIWRWVVVAAPNAALARLVAERWALPRLPRQIGNESASPRVGFLDEKLYHVRPVKPGPGWWGTPTSDAEQVIDAALLREAPGRIEA